MAVRPLDPIRELLRKHPCEWFYLGRTDNPTGANALQRNLRSTGDQDFVTRRRLHPVKGYRIEGMWAGVTDE